MPRRRRPPPVPPAGPEAELLDLERECAAAAAAGDGQAAALLGQVRSWLAMWRAAGCDREIGELFATEGRARMDEWWHER